MRARNPDHHGEIRCDGVRIGYEVFGDGAPTVLLLPTWTIVHSRFWKAQVPYLARHYRVVTFDGPGNGAADRPVDQAAYTQDAALRRALAVLDATGTDQAVLVALSRAADWALRLAAEHPHRVLGTAFIAPAVALLPPPPTRAKRGDFLARYDEPVGWQKFNAAYWREHWEDFARFFFDECFTEPHSTKQREDAVGWALATTPEVLVAERLAPRPTRDQLLRWCARVDSPVLVVHGSDDRVRPHGEGAALAEATGGTLVTIEGAGHLPPARDPVQVNLLVREFVDRLAPPVSASRTVSRGRARPRRVLCLSSPIGLGHARRDLAIAHELRRHHPDVQVDWLAQDPVTRLLAAQGERVHPASAHLASESAHIEDEAGEHDLHCFQAWRRMDEILVANFMLFHDVVTDGDYDLVVGDESWEVDYFLHENPQLKSFAYAWLTDFVGWLPMPDGAHHERALTTDYNAEMIEHIARYPRVRDRAVFVGSPDDIVPDSFGPGLPAIRTWTTEHYAFAGYVLGAQRPWEADRDALRAVLGYRPDEQVCVVTVGGSGVGVDLLRRVVAGYPFARDEAPGLRMVVVTGPRIDPAVLDAPDGVEMHAFVPDLDRHLAACDLAVVQGGLTTCMELTAARRPFLYVPLRHHFEQNFHVPHRLARYGAGFRLDYDDIAPDRLGKTIATEIGRDVDYRPVETDGATRVGALLAELL